MKSKILFSGLILFSMVFLKAGAQNAVAYNMADLLQQNQIMTTPLSGTKPLKDKRSGAISTVNRVLFKELRFTEGTIDIDLRGKNKFLQSFLGIIFHAEDTTTYDVLFFRPFNFKHADTSRHGWSVTYNSMPQYSWQVLRKTYPRVYENKVNPVPNPDDWFHATIVIKGTDLKVYVNHAAQPSLEVQLLNGRRDGKLGLFSDGLKSDFANLVITALKEDEKTIHYSLVNAMQQKQLQLERRNGLLKSSDSTHNAVGVLDPGWMAILTGSGFSSGTLEIDIKGRDLLQQSFPGIAFHVKDATTYEGVYFRPFNFNSPDSIRHHHAVQYIYMPDYPWFRLRKEYPEAYEANVINPPGGDDWFHAKIVVDGEWITVYVNYSCIPSLHIKSLANLGEGKLAIWSDGSFDLFADLYVRKE